ncbi:MAG: hypothetical protein PHH47_12845 [Gallionella sp.]|nr:hypothetical protein [Gallionella sp.]MDD4946573.1 hypothetical protein [Gallionella sp.]
MTDQEEFERFKSQHKDLTRDALFRLAFDYYAVCKVTTGALKSYEAESYNLLAQNNALCELVIAHGWTDEIKEELRPLVEKNRGDLQRGREVAARGIANHADLKLRNVRSNISRTAGKESGQNRKNELEERNKKIRAAAQAEINKGTLEHQIASKLATRFSLSPKQIRAILKKT